MSSQEDNEQDDDDDMTRYGGRHVSHAASDDLEEEEDVSVEGLQASLSKLKRDMDESSFFLNDSSSTKRNNMSKRDDSWLNQGADEVSLGGLGDDSVSFVDNKFFSVKESSAPLSASMLDAKLSPAKGTQEGDSSKSALVVASSQMIDAGQGVQGLQESIELDGLSTFVRREIDITLLFKPPSSLSFRAQSIQKRSPKRKSPRTSDRFVSGGVSGTASVAGEAAQVAPALSLSIARCSALERRVEELTSLKVESDNALLGALARIDDLESIKPPPPPSMVEDPAASAVNTSAISSSSSNDESTREKLAHLEQTITKLTAFQIAQTKELETSASQNSKLLARLEEQADLERIIMQLRSELESAQSKNSGLEAHLLQMSKAADSSLVVDPALSVVTVTAAEKGEEEPGQSRRLAIPASPNQVAVNALLASQRQQEEERQTIDATLLSEQTDKQRAVFKALNEERSKLQNAQARIQSATQQSSKSLSLAVQELRTLESARQRAEAHAAALEVQVKRSQLDMVHLLSLSRENSPTLSPSDGISPALDEMHRQRDNSSFAPQPLQKEEQQERDEEERQNKSQMRSQPTQAVAEPVPPRSPRVSGRVNESQWSFADMFPQDDDSQSNNMRKQGGRSSDLRSTYESSAQAMQRAVAEDGSPDVAIIEPKDQWANSRESLTPYATESSLRDLQAGFSLLERKLLMINIEREKREADFARISNRGVKTKKALEEKMFLESRIAELHKEASNVRVALKRAPK